MAFATLRKHTANKGECSWANFSRAIFVSEGKQKTVKNVTTEEYGVKAARPTISRISKDKFTENGYHRLSIWQEVLARY